jgi:amidase
MDKTRRAFMFAAGSAVAAISLPQAMAGGTDQAKSGDTGAKALDYQSAKELSALLRAKQLSAVELADRAIARIEAYDGKLNAVVVRDFERARAAAIEADKALARGDGGPLLGLPMTVKECVNVAGLPTTWGIPGTERIPAREDAVTVERLRAAGAILLGSRRCSPTCRAITRSMGPPTIPGIRTARRAVLRAARLRRLQPVMCRSNSAPTTAARCASRRISAAS